MKRILPLLAVAALAALFWFSSTAEKEPSPATAADPAGTALLQQAQQRIAAYHAGQPASGAVLRIVYFYPSDREPLPHYAERLERIMADVNDFYTQGMQRFGLSYPGLPLEKRHGRLVLHLVKGKLPASGYRHESGSQTAAEIRQALLPVFDLHREHVLVLYALCSREQDGRYIFHAPYYGGGSQASGLCHAADCELLDPALLRSTERMVFTEHYYPRREMTVGQFNSMYLGGVAHELGHGLGLFHDAGTPEEQSYGTALMGSGNLTYRNDLRGEPAASFLSRVSALHLASHPLTTGSALGRWQEEKTSLQQLQFSTTPAGQLSLRAVAAGAVPAYAAVAYVWKNKPGSTDHSSITYPTAVQEDGSFELKLHSLPQQMSFLRLTLLHTNGAAHHWDYHLEFDAQGHPSTPVEFRWPWVVAKAEQALLHAEPQVKQLLSADFIARAKPEDASYLRILQQAWQPIPAADLATVQADTAWLSDMQWQSATVGWGQPTRNHYYYDRGVQDGIFLALRGHVYEKGLYAHLPATHLYDLQGRWKTFTASCGLRDGAQSTARAIFRVLADGRELYRSAALSVGQQQSVQVDVSGVKKLELITEAPQGSSKSGGWSIWVQPQLIR